MMAKRIKRKKRKDKKPSDWAFEMVEVSGPEGELVDNALDIYYRLEAAGEHVITPTPILKTAEHRLPEAAGGTAITVEWQQKKNMDWLQPIRSWFLGEDSLNDNLGVQPC